MMFFNNLFFFYFREYPIIIKNLRKVFGDKVAVNRVSLRLRNGECFGLLGPNGAVSEIERNFDLPKTQGLFFLS